MIKDSTIFVGLDLGDKTSEICILDEEGEGVEDPLQDGQGRIERPVDLPKTFL